MPRERTKNCINMHDIVGQTLGSLPDAVDAVLRRPEVLDQAEIQSIFHESSYIFLRAEEALSARHMASFEALMRLFSEGLTHSESGLEEGVKTLALQPSVLKSLENLFRWLVNACTSAAANNTSSASEKGEECEGAVPLHCSAVVELTQVIGSLCDAEALKDRCGEYFMPGLVRLLESIYSRPDEAHRHFRLQRSVATALINLVKGSRANKMRLPSWRFIAVCCVASVDVFFQLQCVELLFRVSRQKRHVLTDVESVMSRAHVQMLRVMPNDATLLLRMMELVKDLHTQPQCVSAVNSEVNDNISNNEGSDKQSRADDHNPDRAMLATSQQTNRDVLCYPLTRLTAADTVVTEATDAYFTACFVVVMVTTSSADNITLPYAMIRSITLSKDGRVTIRLSEFPTKLETLLSQVAGMDTITLHMAPGTLLQFKQSSVRLWIVRALHERRSEQQKQRQHESLPSRKRVLNATTTLAAAATAETAAVSCRSHDPCDSDQDAGLDRHVPRPPPPPQNAEEQQQSSKLCVPWVLSSRANDTAIGCDKENVAIAAAATAATAETIDGTAASATIGNSVAETQVDRPRPRQRYTEDVDRLLQQLRRVAAAKLELRRVQTVDELNACMSLVQTSVDEARQSVREVRQAWQQEALSEVSQVATRITQAQEATVTAVSQLNDSLHAIKTSNQALQDRVSCAEVEVRYTLDDSRRVEEEVMRELSEWQEREWMRCEVALGTRLLPSAAVLAAGSLITSG